MDLNKLMIDFLAEEGFRPHETEFGIAFKHEGFNFLYFKDEEDEQYFRLMMPAIFEVTEDNEEMILKEGDEVLYGKYAGTELEFDGEKYLMMRQSDVLAIIK